MTSTDKFHIEHRALLTLAGGVMPQEPVSPAAAERSRKQLTLFGARFAEHLAHEAETMAELCNGKEGDLAVACTIRNKEVDGLSESIAGVVARWGRSGAIEDDPVGFISVWEMLLVALRRLHAREEADIYPTSGRSAFGPVAPPEPTGIPGLDRDHDHLFAILKSLRALPADGLHQIDARVAADLAAYAERHFADEEAIMDATAFPGLEDHRREHHLARIILLGFRNDHLEGRHVQAAAVLEFLERWFATHIALVDQVMVKHALAAGWQP